MMALAARAHQLVTMTQRPRTRTNYSNQFLSIYGICSVSESTNIEDVIYIHQSSSKQNKTCPMLRNKRTITKNILLITWLTIIIAAFNIWHKIIWKKLETSELRQIGLFTVPQCTINRTLLSSWRPILNCNYQKKDCIPIVYKRLYDGLWAPVDCSPLTTVAIVIPYRDREEHLHKLLINIHMLLRMQQATYGVYVIEQIQEKQINRGTLRNIGYAEAMKQYNHFDCFIFHDVDLIPENATNMYKCHDQPSHLSAAVDSFNYRIPYKEIFGGVVALSKEQFQTSNGYSNRFYHWGGEDDDIHGRLYLNGYRRIRSSMTSGRYKMLHHHKSQRNPYRFLLGWHDIKSGIWKRDGINNLNYKIIDNERRHLYDWIHVDFDDSKADLYIHEAIQEIRSELPPRFKYINDTQIAKAVVNLKQYYRGPYQVLNVIQKGLKAGSRFA